MPQIVLQIVPQLPPNISGVGDYALCLAHQMRNEFSLQSHFLVCNPEWDGEAEIAEFPITKLDSQDYSSLIAVLKRNSASSVLLHYVGYGYEKRGCPTWLIKGLKSWKKQMPSSRLVTMFHEIYATSYKPWTSSFWLFPLQKKLASELVNLSFQCVTSQDSYVERIKKLSISKNFKIKNFPVFSNFGEPQNLKPLVERERKLVILGHPSAKLAIYQKYHRNLQLICQIFAIDEIHDVGIPTGFDFDQLAKVSQVNIIERGVLSSIEISHLLSNSILNFADFPNPYYLAKSTIFASLCAHKVLSIRTVGNKLPIDGLQDGCHYISLDLLFKNKPYYSDLHLLQKIVDNAHAWYQPHNLLKQTAFFVENLLNTRN